MPRINRTTVLPNSTQEIVQMASIALTEPFDDVIFLDNFPEKMDEILLDFRPLVLSEKAPPKPELPVNFIQKIANLAQVNSQKFGIILAGSSDYRAFADNLPKILPLLDVIVIDFAGFRDGRGYSLAQEIRQHDSFTDKTVLRVMGDILPDTLELLAKVGFEEFEIDNPEFNESWFGWFESIKTPYNGRNVKQLPMFAGVGELILKI